MDHLLQLHPSKVPAGGPPENLALSFLPEILPSPVPHPGSLLNSDYRGAIFIASSQLVSLHEEDLTDEFLITTC